MTRNQRLTTYLVHHLQFVPSKHTVIDIHVYLAICYYPFLNNFHLKRPNNCPYQTFLFIKSMMYIYYLPYTSWFKGDKHNTLANYLPYRSWFKGDQHNILANYLPYLSGFKGDNIPIFVHNQCI